MPPRNVELRVAAVSDLGQQIVKAQDATLLADQDVRFDLRLPGTGAIRGSLHYSSGAAVPNLPFQLFEQGNNANYSVAGDANGMFHFDGLAAGAYTVRYEVGGVAASHPVNVSVGQITPLDVTLLAGTVKGRVTYGDGRPVISTSVQIGTTDGASLAATSTDAEGRFQFDRAIAGERTLIVSTGSFRIVEPVSIRDGATVEHDLLLRAGTLQGRLLFQAGLVAGNVRLALMDKDGSFYRTATTNYQGEFSMKDVPAGTYSARDDLNGRQLAAGIVIGNGAVAQVEWTLADNPALLVRATRANGGPLAGALVYRQDRYLLGITNSAGIAGIGLASCNSTNQFTATYPGVPALEVRSPVLAPDCTGLQPVALQFPAVASLHIAVTRNGAPLAGAYLRSLDWRGGAGPQLPETGANGMADIDGLTAGSYTVEVATADGQVQRASFTVGASDDGAVVSRQFDFNTEADRTARLTFKGERQLWSVPLKAGDKLAIAVQGVPLDGAPALNYVRAGVFDPQRGAIASGYGYGYNSQFNLDGDLKQVNAQVDGNYPIAIQAHDAESTGGYRLALEVNGQSVAAQPYQDGGAVQGKVLRADGVTIVPGQVVDLRTGDALALHVRTVSNEKGEYQFDFVPTGALDLALYAQDKVAGGAQVVLEQAGQVLEQDLRLQAVTKLDITVSIDQALPLPAEMHVQLTDAAGTRQVGPVVFAGNRTSQVLSIAAAGDSITVEAKHPDNSTVAATQDVAAADGQTVPVQLALVAVGLSGRVLDGAGQPMPGTYIYVWRASDKGYLGGGQANGAGEYVVTGLPTGVALLVTAYNNMGMTATRQVPALTTPNLGGQDVRFPATGSVSGRVVYTSGTPVANASVKVTGSVPYAMAQGRAARSAGNTAADSGGDAFTLSATTDADGNFQVGAVPAGASLRVAVNTPGPFAATLEAPATAVAGQDVRLPDFVFERGAALKIDVRDGDLQRNLLLYSATIGECGKNFVQLTTSQGSVRLDLSNYWEDPDISLADRDLAPVLNVPHGPVTIGYFDACSDNRALASTQVDISGDADYQATLSVQVVRGVARYNPGVPMPSYYIYAVQVAPDGSETWFSDVPKAEHETPGEYAFVGLQPGEFTIRLTDAITFEQTTTTATLGAQGNLVLDLVAAHTGPAIIVGNARHADGTALYWSDLVLYQGPNVTHGTTDSDGEFKFAAEQVRDGPFELSVYDSKSGLSTTVSGTVESGKVNVVELRLPATATVVARLHTAAGAPIDFADVFLNSASTPDFTQVAGSNWQGEVTFARVPLGHFTVLAQAPDTGLVAMATGSNDTPDETINVDLVVPAGASVSGRVLDATGSTPVPNAEVVLQTVRDFGNVGVQSWAVTADADGNFNLPLVQPGAFRLTVAGDGGSVPAGVTEGMVDDGASANVDVLLGGAARLPATLAGTDGAAYVLTCTGAIRNGGRPFQAEAFGLTVNGRPMPCTPAVHIAPNQSELYFGMTAFGDGGLQVARRAFVPAQGGFVRFIDTYVNTGATERQVTAVVGGGQLGYFASLVDDPENNGQTFAVLGQPAFAMVFGGAGGVPNAPDVFNYTAQFGLGGVSDSSVGYRWMVTVPPGGKVSLMHFAVLASSTADARAAARMLSTNAASSMFDGIAPEDKAAIINFQIP